MKVHKSLQPHLKTIKNKERRKSSVSFHFSDNTVTIKNKNKL